MGELVTGDGVGEASGDLSLHVRLSFASEPRTRMSQAFVMRASTGNRLLFPVLARVTLALIPTNYYSGVCGRFSLGSAFLYISKHVCKQICPVCLQGRKDWIHAPVKAPCGGGLHPFCFGDRFFNPHPPPRFFLLSCLVLSPSRLWTRMSRNSSLEPQAFVMRASTGNKLVLNRKGQRLCWSYCAAGDSQCHGDRAGSE